MCDEKGQVVEIIEFPYPIPASPPPSTTRIDPVMNADALLARNNTA
jgi:hypothetical protein